MVTTITLSADEALIAAAHKTALERKTTLDAEFQKWLADYSGNEAKKRERLARFDDLMKATKGFSTGGRKFTREEMNER